MSNAMQAAKYADTVTVFDKAGDVLQQIDWNTESQLWVANNGYSHPDPGHVLSMLIYGPCERCTEQPGKKQITWQINDAKHSLDTLGQLENGSIALCNACAEHFINQIKEIP